MRRHRTAAGRWQRQPVPACGERPGQMDRQKRRRVLYTCLTVLWMVLIFWMSSAGKDESNAQSGAVCEWICETFVEGYAQMPPARQHRMRERISFPVRKGAHLTEYTVLGILLTLTVLSYMPPGEGAAGASAGFGLPVGRGPMPSEGAKAPLPGGEPARTAGAGALAGSSMLSSASARDLAHAASLALAAGLLYAAGDELHQLFVPGRAGQLRDILIDTAGVLLGTCIVQGAGRLLRARQNTP